MNQPGRIRVFISYTWDDAAHKERVLEFAQRLRRDGIDAWIDQFTPWPEQGWSRWMLDQEDDARFVLCIVTETYAQRFRGRTPKGVGRGGNWEGFGATSDIYHNDSHNQKFVPILFGKTTPDLIPKPLRDYPHFRPDQEDSYEQLYRLLTGQPKQIPLDVGEIRIMPAAPPRVPLQQPTVYRHRDRGNLPRLLYFIGRKDQLDSIADALQPEVRTAVVLIDGPGGMGKTSLAIRAAELASEVDYPQIVFASAKQRELGLEGIQEVSDFRFDGYLDLLSSIARALGDDALDKVNEKDRSQEVIRLLKGQGTLLVLDNLETLHEKDLARVSTFLRHIPEGTKAIVTSRRRPDLPAERIRLDRMDYDTAKELLQELSRHSPLLTSMDDRERVALYEATAGNPLILCWVAGQVGRGRCRTIESAIELLNNSRGGEEALEFVFEDLADSLPDKELRLLAALTFFARPATVAHIAELAKVPPLQASAELEFLVNRSLAIDNVEGRYFIMPLVADFLRRKKPEVIRETGRWIAELTHAFVRQKDDQEYYSEFERFPVLEEGWPKVEAGLKLLQGEQLQEACDALMGFLHCTGRWDESIELARRAEEEAKSRGKYWMAGWRACQVANLMFRRGNADGVRVATDRAFEHWQHAERTEYELGILRRRRGMEHELRGEYDAALDYYRKALDLWRRLSQESEDISRVLNDIAGIRRKTGDLGAAQSDYREALRIAHNVKFWEGIANTRGNLADVALDREKWRAAERLANDALRLSTQMGHSELMAANYRRIAIALAHQGKPGDGLRYARRAEDISKTLRSPELKRAEHARRVCEDALRELGQEEPDEGWLEEAAKGLPAGLEYGDPTARALARYKRGLTLQNQGRHREAEKQLREALAICREAPRTIVEARIRNSLGWTYQRQRRWKEAEECYQDALVISGELGDQGEQSRSEQNLARLRDERAVAPNGDASSLPTQSPDAAEAFAFESEVEAYERADAASPPPGGALLFYGSSSIRLWPSLEGDFPGYPVLNRGFGGATLQDCVRLYPRLVKPYSPAMVVLYAGDNDLGKCYMPEQVAGSLKQLVELLWRDFPAAIVGFISIKPSPARCGQDDIEAANRLIAEFASERENLAFLDIYSRMLKSDGSPDEALFLEDGLHLNPAGYGIWRSVVTTWVHSTWKQRIPALQA
ncbi:MAG TPA: tetratricopeptide repeat protein [Longimicrobiaceae bacterium]|nr:tetratricopeptide repeat protein [Longimicrobiaceae bacterium]